MKVLFEKVPRPSGASFACIEYRGRVFDCPYHRHPEIEILHIEKSIGKVIVGDATGKFRPGQLYLFAPNLPHLFYNDTPVSFRRGWAQSRYVQFLPDCLGTEFWDLPENRRIARLLQDAAQGLLWEGETARQGAKFFYRLFAGRFTHRIARLLDLLDFLASARGGKPLASAGYRPVSDEEAPERINRILLYVHRNLAETIEMEKASALAGLSPSGFSRFFRRSIGRSFMDYVIEQRISEARRLLIETDLTVAEICFRCGFSNLSNFNRHFLSRCGHAPMAWRRDAVSHGGVRIQGTAVKSSFSA
ncbi:MAG: AraC family transcriptional regulator [Methylacidiphilales bacterium]|nr:AraC family transcriptional regulator [Candidatus Methylacidiphilales bacterium]